MNSPLAHGIRLYTLAEKTQKLVSGLELSAEVSCEYENEKIAEAIASSIKPDNIDSPEGVEIETKRVGNEVESKLKVEGEVETLLSTLDDLLSCTSTAEEMI